jgi:hypothetical protein
MDGEQSEKGHDKRKFQRIKRFHQLLNGAVSLAEASWTEGLPEPQSHFEKAKGNDSNVHRD